MRISRPADSHGRPGLDTAGKTLGEKDEVGPFGPEADVLILVH